MRGRGRQDWRQLVGTLGEATSELLRAEVGQLKGDLEQTGRSLLGAATLLLATICVLFWVVGLVVVLLREVASFWLPPWGATLATVALLLLIAGALFALFKRRIRSLERPDDTLRRRWQDHRTWWQATILQGDASDPGGEGDADA